MTVPVFFHFGLVLDKVHVTLFEFLEISAVLTQPPPTLPLALSELFLLDLQQDESTSLQLNLD